MKISFLVSYDIQSPFAGGGAVYVQKVAQHLAKDHEVCIVSHSMDPEKSEFEINGVRIIRQRLQARSLVARIAAQVNRNLNGSDLVVESSDAGGPWFNLRSNRILLSFQLWREIFFYELGRSLAEIAYRLEPSFYFTYRNVPTVSCSKSNAASLTRLGLRYVQVIPPGVDDAFLRNHFSLGEKADHPTLVVLGRLKAYKGIQYVLLAFTRVLRVLPDARLIVIGSGDYMLYLRSFCVSLGIQGSVRFMGKQDEEARVRVLSESHILVNASIREGFGINVLEANACFTPCVGWNVPGTNDAVLDGETGILVEPFSIESMSNALIALLKDKERRVRLAERAHEWSTNFPWDTTCEKFEAFLDQVAPR